MARRWLSAAALAAAFLSAAPAWADAMLTNYHAIGYSRDGRYFAFETFGRSAATDTAYATFFVQDLATNLLVLGTPANAASIDPAEPLGAIIAKARAQAPTVLDDLEIDVPAIIEAVNGDGMRVSDSRLLDFGLLLNDGSARIAGQYQLKLESFDTSASTDCRGLGGGAPVQGFALSLIAGSQVVEVHRDAVLTRSRGCPTSYEVKAVFVPAGANDISRAVVLVAAYVETAEGTERQFLPVGLNVALGMGQ
ncbi:MAG: DUF2259 domain-containing protein [Hyphomicrobiaceae bacterium]|nr:DUF2259 domain-containing protein [Hyphomicrobiaceae bacterium]